MSRQKRQPRRLQFDSLESRDLLSATELIGLSGGVLSLNGTSGGDTAAVISYGGFLLATLRTPSTSYMRAFSNAGIQQILFSGGAGDDKFINQSDVTAVAFGDSGNDALQGGSESDVLIGGPDQDTLNGGPGDDRLISGGGHDVVSGGQGNDIVFGDEGDDQIWGEAGIDVIYGGPGKNLIGGGEGNDLLLGGPDRDTIDGGIGNDTLLGFGDNDTLMGGSGDDWLFGGDGLDVLWGGSDNDVLDGGRGTFNILVDTEGKNTFHNGKLVIGGEATTGNAEFHLSDDQRVPAENFLKAQKIDAAVEDHYRKSASAKSNPPSISDPNLQVGEWNENLQELERKIVNRYLAYP